MPTAVGGSTVLDSDRDLNRPCSNMRHRHGTRPFVLGCRPTSSRTRNFTTGYFCYWSGRGKAT